MQFNRLGNSGLLVTDLCLGTMIFGESSARSTPAEAAERMIHRYLDAGGNHIDTADVYANGRSEEITGHALKGRRDRVVLATKVNFATGPGPNEQGLSRRHILEGVEASLRRLKTDYIDLLYMHCWDPLTPLEESLQTFDALVQSGKVRYIGVSNFKAWQLMKALGTSDARGWIRFVAAQYQYSLVKRDIEYEFCDLCQGEGLSLVPWGPLGGGFLSGKYQKGKRPQDSSEGRIGGAEATHEESWARRNTSRNWDILDQVEAIANDRSATHAQVALAWLRAQPAVGSVIIGARTLAQLEDNLKAADLNLTEAELDLLNSVSQPAELYPYRMIHAYSRKMPD